jgi:hypothetical protein
MLDVICQDTGLFLDQVPNSWINERAFPIADTATGEPTSYAFNGISQAGTDREPDFNVDLYPIPTGVQTISFNVVGAQRELKTASQVLRVPSQPTILGAWAKAISERGEDGGTISSGVAAEARDALNMAVQLDSGNMEYELDWYVG